MQESKNLGEANQSTRKPLAMYALQLLIGSMSIVPLLLIVHAIYPLASGERCELAGLSEIVFTFVGTVAFAPLFETLIILIIFKMWAHFNWGSFYFPVAIAAFAGILHAPISILTAISAGWGFYFFSRPFTDLAGARLITRYLLSAIVHAAFNFIFLAMSFI